MVIKNASALRDFGANVLICGTIAPRRNRGNPVTVLDNSILLLCLTTLVAQIKKTAICKILLFKIATGLPRLWRKSNMPLINSLAPKARNDDLSETYV